MTGGGHNWRNFYQRTILPIATSKHSSELSSARLGFQEMQRHSQLYWYHGSLCVTISLPYQCMCYYEYVTISMLPCAIMCYHVGVAPCYYVLLCPTLLYVTMSVLPYYVCHNVFPVWQHLLMSCERPQNSDVPVYKQMGEFMRVHRDDVLVGSNDEGIQVSPI